MGRLRGCLWLTAGLVVALLAATVGYLTLARAASLRSGQGAQVPQVQVVVASRAIAVRTVLTASDLQVKDVPVDIAPEGAVRRAELAVGKVTLADLYPGETVLAQRLIDPNLVASDGRTAVALASEQVLMAFPADDLMSRSGVLKPGDHVDLLFSMKFKLDRGSDTVSSSTEMPIAVGVVVAGQTEELATFDVLQNGVISAIVAGAEPERGSVSNTPQAILLTVSPQDALLLKYVKDAGGILDIVVRAPGAERPFSTESVDQDYVLRKYRVLPYSASAQ